MYRSCALELATDMRCFSYHRKKAIESDHVSTSSFCAFHELLYYNDAKTKVMETPSAMLDGNDSVEVCKSSGADVT